MVSSKYPMQIHTRTDARSLICHSEPDILEDDLAASAESLQENLHNERVVSSENEDQDDNNSVIEHTSVHSDGEVDAECTTAVEQAINATEYKMAQSTSLSTIDEMESQ
jgi:hypothetical protein